jgi:ketosteroid isomerase-like protein
MPCAVESAMWTKMLQRIRVVPSEMVRGYYTNIDAGNIPAALACFASTAIYRRPGYDALNGLAEIESFYESTRVVGPGRHQIEVVIESDQEVAVRGRFGGSFRDGAPLRVRFADFWRFSAGKVAERNSYFDAPVA